MEIVAAKSESISPRRRLFSVLEGEIMETKRVKRRRRDSSAVPLSCNNQQGEQQQQQGQANQISPTITVKRSSRFRGVSRHRWTGRYEAHLWDKDSWNSTQRKKGKQVYLGAYDEEESAARAYDLAALKYWGTSTFINFPVSDYEKEIEIMKTVTKEEYLASLRRRSSGFSRGISRYRGVARHHHNGRWEARIGRVFGNKYLYLGTYSTQEEAAHAYDIAAIEYRGISAVTNFDLSTYTRWLKPGANPPLTSQEPIPTADSQPAKSPSNCIPREQTTANLSIFNNNPFAVEGLNTSNNKQDIIIQRKEPNFSPCTRSSSPTALGLLLRSSVFKDLVEKNLSTTEEDAEENDNKNLELISNNNELGELFFNEFGNVPLIVPSNRDLLPALESREQNGLPLYNNRTGQSLWNGALITHAFH